MLIGLDFDNTIACYNDVFSSEAKIKGLVNKDWKGSKKDLKRFLNSQEDGQTAWQAIQGQVYGPSMQKATLFPGVARFLFRCKLRGHTVFIVSHKTKYGHFDKTKTLLRESSLKWMDSQGFFKASLFGINRENIFFANTQSEKVLKIKSLNLDVFVDDLEEIFLHHDFPEIKKILFGRSSSIESGVELCNNWTDIEKTSIGVIENCEIKHLVNSIYDEPINNVEKLKGRGNSRIYKLSFNKKNSILLKDYPDLSIDPRPRMQTEVNALKLVGDLNKTPKVIAFDKLQNIALYEWIKGDSLYKIEDQHIRQALDFIENLQSLKGKNSWVQASEACFSARQLIKQINFRFDRLLKANNKDLNDFLVYTFKPLLSKVWESSEKNWPSDNLEKELPKSMQIFSPSDFGFHNAVLKENGDLVFLDFEYFGRDDPVKLMADFIWHPGMKLNNLQKIDWVKGIIGIFDDDSGLVKRFKSAWPMYGLRWALIVLNEFLEDGWHKRIYANDKLRRRHKKKLANQLITAKDICEQIQVSKMECPYMNDFDEQNI
jgi:hypothetical protein